MKNIKYILLLFLTVMLFASGCDSKKESTDKPASDTIKKDNTVAPGNDKGTGASEDETVSAGTVSGITYDVKDLLKILIFDGKFVAGVRWQDKNGENAVILSETDEKVKKGKGGNEDDWRSKELYGYHFIIKDGSAEELWKVQDFVKDCQFDITMEHMKKSLTVTDLDSNGIAETAFIYKLTCRSDVSPADMKLIMHEGKEKYAIRGEMEISLPNGDEYGGKMNPDKSFSKAPESFLKYAKKHWEQFKTERYD
ncbi:MAG: hypothetical protein MUE56_08865 [Ignavibacteria bacterium]|jgi:hypothetical protein|nr:hypothetical protein [Ignavibacteria bacterium]